MHGNSVVFICGAIGSCSGQGQDAASPPHLDNYIRLTTYEIRYMCHSNPTSVEKNFIMTYIKNIIKISPVHNRFDI